MNQETHYLYIKVKDINGKCLFYELLINFY